MFTNAPDDPKKDHLVYPVDEACLSRDSALRTASCAGQAAICLAASNTSRISRIQSFGLTNGAMTLFLFCAMRTAEVFRQFL